MFSKTVIFSLFLFSLISWVISEDCDKNLPQDEEIAKDFKHMAMLGYDIGSRIIYGCVGILIDQNHVLTTAECSRKETIGAPISVRLGISCEHFQYHNISNISAHPEFDPDSFENATRSVALVKLETPAESTDFVNPTKLYKTKIFDKQKPIEAAWVRLPDNEDQLIVVKFILKILPFPKCSENYHTRTPSVEIRKKSEVCAYPIEEPQDSLGIIHLMKNGHLQPVGIMAGGSGYPPTETYPNIYIRISHYIKWIRENMENDEE
nr:melanization protease 1-like [Onthophagus taurus]